MEEEDGIKLYNNSKERGEILNLANLHSIIIAMELLEKGYSSGIIEPEEYTEECNLLIAQYKVALTSVSKKMPNLDTFLKTYQFEAPLAKFRFQEGYPATLLLAKNENNNSVVKKTLFAGEKFITVIDSLELGYNQPSQLFPELSALAQTINSLALESNGIQNFDGKDKIFDWLRVINSMKANQELTEDEIHNFKFDIDKAYIGFKDALP
ncbi:vacuolar sorting-associated protein [Neoconidiobolus thromboides FSU 785]|nr:vacuolar sorting-associated protein [Neoconidiobolus thromboides FSU 785]